MEYLPDFSDGSKTFIEGLMRTNATRSTRVRIKPAETGLKDRLIPPGEREPIVSREAVYIKEDEDLIEWEWQLRTYLHKLPQGRAHRIAGIQVWEWATGLSVQDEHQKGNRKAYAKDLRKLNLLLTSYFGPSKPTYINNRKYNRVYWIGEYFLVDRKRPYCVSLYLEWKAGAKIR